jgi:protein-L-isoaspartate(D-aspartate) O-methyltransferase
VGPHGSVVGVEIVPELVEVGRANLARCERPNATIRPAVEGVLGLPEEAPFERILVSAGATAMPQPLVDQLAEDGVMVVPVGGRMHEVRRTAAGVEDHAHGHYSFVPLITPAG